jgi:AsmA protein
MPRRVVLIIALATLALLTVALAPWTLSTDVVATSISQHLRDGYGLDLEVRGRSTIAILPVPRVKFENVTLASSDRTIRAEGGTLRGELRLLPLIAGRIELGTVNLSGSRVSLDGEAVQSLDWQRLTESIRGRRASVSHIRRLVLNASSIRWGSGQAGSLDDVGLIINWPGPQEKLEVAGWATWRGERIELTQASVSPAVLASGQPSPFVLAVKAGTGRVSITGEAQAGSEPRIAGQSVVESRSVRDFSRWSGLELPLGSLMRAVSVEGDFTMDRRRVTWPSVAVTLGPDRLEGTLAVRFEGRPVVTGTLAADQINLSDFFTSFAQARTASGLWSGDDTKLLGATGGDLDLRLSATDARIGRLRLGDMAASVLVRPGRIEASLGRANLNKGTLKGRLTLAALEGGTDVKAQGTFDRVDVASFLAAIGETRWISGEAHGQFALEGSGATIADIVRQTRGRMSVTVGEGELIGIGLNDALRFIEKRPLAASLEWKGGRTAFDQAQVSLAVEGGVGEITEGMLAAPTLRTALKGQVSFVDRSLAVRAQVDPAQPGPSPLIVFDITGGWDDVAIIPDAKALIQRSGAAKPLFGLERLAPATRGASATPPTAP